MRVLVVEDEARLAETLRDLLEMDGWTADVCHDGEAGLDNALSGIYDVVLLDVMLPKLDGFTVLRELRRSGSAVPVLMLTARSEVHDRVEGLDSGADDYITKPFKLGELCSRIRARLRRSGTGDVSAANRFTSGPVSIDLFGGGAFLNGEPLNLTNAEYRLLCLLVRNAGQTVLRNTILDALWDGNGNFVDDNTLSVYIRRLREKIEEDPSNPAHLLTVRGFGYKWMREV